MTIMQNLLGWLGLEQNGHGHGIKPCPFCGAMPCDPTHMDVRRIRKRRADDGTTATVYVVECGWCHATGPDADSPETAIIEWNRR